MACLYIKRPLPIVLLLHNAEYQGTIETQQFRLEECEWLGSIFNISADVIRAQALVDGSFNMLKPAINWIRQRQHGRGVCTVSKNYAEEIMQKFPLLWSVQRVKGIDNPVPEEERAALANLTEAQLLSVRRNAKLSVQKQYGLRQDIYGNRSRLFVFLGRWVKQKGMDYIADVAEWMLDTYPEAQLMMIGPIGDSYGSYTHKKLQSITESGRFSDRLFVHADFMQVAQELKFACDFCLMPSRDEPFGFVDLEFASHGAAVVGSMRGGLAKCPGFYYQVINSESSHHIQTCLKAAIRSAMDRCPESVLNQMAVCGLRQCHSRSYSIDGWQQELKGIYMDAVQSFKSSDPMEMSALEMLTEAPGENSINLSKLLIPEATMEATLKPPTQRMNISVASMPNPSVLTDMISSVCGDIQRADEEEFLRQSVDETVLQRLVEAKLTITSMTGANAASAETLLAGVKWTLEMAREKYSVTRFLGHCFLDIPLIDWVICANYVIGPCGRLIMPTEKFSIFTHPDVQLQVLNDEALIGSLMTSLAVVFWTVMCMFIRPNRLMFTVILIRVLIPILLVMPRDDSGSMYVVHCVYNFITAGDIILIYFGFMGKAQGDMAKLAAVTGLLITLRQSVDAVSTGAASATVSASGGVALAVWALISVMGVLILWAPVSYHNFRLPSIWEQLKNLGKRRVLVFVGLATVADGIYTVLDETASRWFQLSADGNIGQSIYGNFALWVSVMTLAPLIFAILCLHMPTSSIQLIKGYAFFSIPLAVLRLHTLLAFRSDSRLSTLLSVTVALSWIPDILRELAVTVVVLATVGSRWRFMVYMCVVTSTQAFASAATLFVTNLTTISSDLTASEENPFLQSIQTYMMLPIVLSIVCRLIASLFFEREATGILRTKREQRLKNSLMLQGATPGPQHGQASSAA
uniref:Uncharacterized protein n=2 Tax=Noctiluca scintillans TaxID=2966 RepID=A0A7S1A2A0_NOCSC